MGSTKTRKGFHIRHMHDVYEVGMPKSVHFMLNITLDMTNITSTDHKVIKKCFQDPPDWWNLIGKIANYPFYWCHYSAQLFILRNANSMHFFFQSILEETFFREVIVTKKEYFFFGLVDVNFEILWHACQLLWCIWEMIGKKYHLPPSDDPGAAGRPGSTRIVGGWGQNYILVWGAFQIFQISTRNLIVTFQLKSSLECF